MSELHDDEIEVIDFEPVTETKRGFSYRFRMAARVSRGLWFGCACSRRGLCSPQIGAR
jgi:hypothetical protein